MEEGLVGAHAWTQQRHAGTNAEHSPAACSHALQTVTFFGTPPRVSRSTAPEQCYKNLSSGRRRLSIEDGEEGLVNHMQLAYAVADSTELSLKDPSETETTMAGRCGGLVVNGQQIRLG